MARLKTLVLFDGTNGGYPFAGLTIDAAGNLFGTTNSNDGTVFELTRTADGYAAAPVTLATFSGLDGSSPLTELVLDADDNLLGTTFVGGTGNNTFGLGTVFQLSKLDDGYAPQPSVIVSFTDTTGINPTALTINAAGDLIGTTQSGGSGGGTIYRIAKADAGYVPVVDTLASFDYEAGSFPVGSLVQDAAGNIFGTTQFGGSAQYGTVYELPKTPGGYAETVVTLFSFDYDVNGAIPISGLIADADGNLFGTTGGRSVDVGLSGDFGTVFEIAKTAAGYAAPVTLVSFNGVNGSGPAGVILDAAGNLFGTTYGGGPNNDGTVFKVAKTVLGYDTTPTILVTFSEIDGLGPRGPLVADGDGNLFGTTVGGGVGNYGTVFEVSGAGFVVACFGAGTRIETPMGDVAVEDLAIGDLVVTAGGAAEPVRWIGRRSYAGRFLAGQRHILPILFRAGSLGGGLPRRDLRVSPAHAMFLDGVLVPAACLVNGTSIVQDVSCRRIDYVHVELARHDIILADGAASETFVDDDSRGVFQNAAEYAVRYPGAAAPAGFCARRVESGFELDAIRCRLAGVAYARAA